VYRHRHWVDPASADRAEARQTAGLVGLVVILMLLIAGLFLVQHLRSAMAIEDCLLAGRNNCDALVVRAR
jgi:hypothetical protein